MKERKEGKDEKEGAVELQLALGQCADSFNLENAVCNHGLFMMAPNRWIPSKKTLERPLRLADSITSLPVSIQQPDHHYLIVQVHGVHHLSSHDQQAILVQVARMLRISTKDERDLQKFQSMHPQAKKKGFGRIFRSPTFFEDVVKSFLLCNCTWARTLKMTQKLCKLQLQLSSGLISHDLLVTNSENFDIHCIERKKGLKRKRATKNSTGKKGLKRKSQATKNSTGKKGLKRELQASYKNSSDDEVVDISVDSHDDDDDHIQLGNFPNPQELAKFDVKILEERCNLGYRASHILRFAINVVCGKLKLKEPEPEPEPDQEVVYDYDDHAVPYLQLQKKMMKVKGFGPFSCTNLLMCTGYYRNVPTDSETIRHLLQIHGRKNCNNKTVGAIVEEIYGKYSPFQCLAYWFELLEYYESKHGRLSELPNSSYGDVTGSIDMRGGN